MVGKQLEPQFSSRASNVAKLSLHAGKTLQVPTKANDFIEMSDDSESDLDSTTKKRPFPDDENKPDPNEPVEELLKVKKKRYTKPFSEELLISPNGLEKIYNEFPLYCPYSKNRNYPSLQSSASSSHEGEYLKKLLSKYKEWAFQLHPGISFHDVVNKCEILGSKGRIRGYMSRLRDRERDRYMNEVLLPIARKQSKYIEMQNKKQQLMEEKQKKEEEIAEKEKLQKAIDESNTFPQDDVQPTKAKVSFPEDDDDEWNPFDIEEPVFKNPAEPAEIATQIDNLQPSQAQEIETQIDEIPTYQSAPATDATMLSESNIAQPIDSDKAAEKEEEEQEDIFGEDSDEEISPVQIAEPRTAAPQEDEEVQTFPQE